MADITVERIFSASSQSQLKSISRVFANIVNGRLRLILVLETHERMGYEYHDSKWKNFANYNIVLPAIITEKTAVIFSLTMLYSDDIYACEREFFRRFKNYSITKLMLLREITTKYLPRDLLIILFRFTE